MNDRRHLESEVDAFLLREPFPARADELAVPLFRAVDTGNGDTVLVAALWQLEDDDPGRVISLYDRALALSRLEHPRLPILIASASPEQARPFVCWALPQGETLRARITRNYPDLRSAVRTALCVAEGLAAIHAAGELHGALAPANVLTNERGEGWLLAPGLGPSVLGPSADPQGAAAYRAPEQLPGGDGPIGAQSDVFSLGVILYEMLGCERPYRGESATELREQMERLPPPTLLSVPGYLPQELEDVLERTLQPRPSDRFASAAEAAERLRAMLQLVDPSPPRVVASPGGVARSTERAGPSREPLPAYRRTPSRPRMPWAVWMAERRLQLESEGASLLTLWIVPGLLLALLIALGLWYWLP